MHQYIARLQLLNAGLIAESHQVVHFMPSAIREEEDEDAEDAPKKGRSTQSIPAQVLAESIEKMKAYVKDNLHRAKKRGNVKDGYKDGLVYTERRQLLDEVLRVQSKSWRVRCSRCNA